MMQLDEYDDALRRVLYAAADLVEPSPDGLERIRARLTPPQPALIAWLLAAYSDLIRSARGWAQSAVIWAQPALSRLRPALNRLQPILDRLRVALGQVIERFRPARPDAAHPQRRYAWLRPAAAMGTAVFVAAMGAFALTALPQVISSSNVFVLPFTSGGSTGSGGAVNGHGAPLPLPPGQVFTYVSPGTQSPMTEMAPTCSVAPSPVPSGPTASPSPSTAPPPPPSASPTAPPPPSPSPSASPSPSPSASNSDPAPPPSSPAPDESPNASVPAAASLTSPAAVAATLDAAPVPSSPVAAPCGPAPTKAAPTKGAKATRGNAQAKLG